MLSRAQKKHLHELKRKLIRKKLKLAGKASGVVSRAKKREAWLESEKKRKSRVRRIIRKLTGKSDNDKKAKNTSKKTTR